MSFEKAQNELELKGFGDMIIVFDVSSATVELAAKALGCQEAHIAKTLAFDTAEGCVVIVTAGDMKIDNHKYKETFHQKAKMLSADETLARTGHMIGGVCPFGLNDGVVICLDVSLRRFDTVYPACGSPSSAVRLSVSELESLLPEARWVDVSKSVQ